MNGFVTFQVNKFFRLYRNDKKLSRLSNNYFSTQFIDTYQPCLANTCKEQMQFT